MGVSSKERDQLVGRSGRGGRLTCATLLLVEDGLRMDCESKDGSDGVDGLECEDDEEEEEVSFVV